ncbi:MULTISPECIES: GntR family transcriptional regulator [Cupriavidus]|uniref:GntR family transcriptional regulator n=1 Tax=Cupriavidus TaxID=106589 RepID=UPI00168ACDA5|nr:GntR family transcriptional regulator [Cupriavidus pauculus]
MTTGSELKIPESSAVATLVYNEIKQRIISLRYAPGEKLSEARLADELGCGRSPIRTAFAQLRNDDWIAVSPQSGTYVRSLTEEEIHEIFEYRFLLESYVTRQAATRMSDDTIRRLRAAFRRFASDDASFESQSFDEFNELDATFHSTIYRTAGNGLMTDSLLNLLDKLRWLKKMTPSPPLRMKDAVAELESILDAIEARDADLAEARMREHIGNAADFAEAYRTRMANVA